MGKRRGSYNKTIEIEIIKELYLDIKSIFGDEKKVSYKGENISLDNVLLFFYIFNKVCWNQRMYSKKKSNFFEVHLNAQILRKCFIGNYKIYIDFLIDNDFIKLMLNHDTTKNLSKKYCLHKKYVESHRVLVKYEILKKSSIYKKYVFKDGNSKYEYEQRKNARRKFPHLTNKFNNKLKIDVDSAISELNKKYGVGTNELNVEDKEHGYKLAFSKIKKFKHPEWRASYNSKTDGRLHTNFTNLNSFLKKHITYDGYRLGEVDIKTSQPMLLLATLNHIFIDKSDCELGSFVTKYFQKRNRKKIEEVTLKESDFLKFKNDILERDFYNAIGEHFEFPFVNGSYVRVKEYKNNKGEVIKKETIIKSTKRDIIKGIVLEALYSKPRTFNEDVKKVHAIYPSVFKVVNKIKELNFNSNKVEDLKRAKKEKKKKAVMLSDYLQQVEAYILLECLAKEFASDHPDEPSNRHYQNTINYIIFSVFYFL